MGTSTDRDRAPVAWLLFGLAALVVGFGVLVALYATLLLPSEVDRGQNPLAWPLRLLQFAFACGVPIAGAIAAHASANAANREGSLRRPLGALALAVVSFAGWVLIFFDWWG